MKVPKIHVSSLIAHRHTKQKEIKKHVRLTRLMNINYTITRTHERFFNHAKLHRKIQLYVLRCDKKIIITVATELENF